VNAWAAGQWPGWGIFAHQGRNVKLTPEGALSALNKKAV
jgi:hypothetical protein